MTRYIRHAAFLGEAPFCKKPKVGLGKGSKVRFASYPPPVGGQLPVAANRPELPKKLGRGPEDLAKIESNMSQYFHVLELLVVEGKAHELCYACPEVILTSAARMLCYDQIVIGAPLPSRHNNFGANTYAWKSMYYLGKMIPPPC